VTRARDNADLGDSFGVLGSGEVQEIKDKAEELWTDEVKTAWTTFQAEQEAEREG